MLAILLAGLVIGGMVGALWSASRAPSYASTATLMVALPDVTTDQDVDAMRGRGVMAPDLATIAVTPDAVARVTTALGITDQAAAVFADANARAEPGSTQLTITARHRDPQTAAAIANGLANDLLHRTGGNGTGSLVSIGPAQPPASPDMPVVPMAVAIGGVVGLAVAAGVLLAGVDRRRRRDGVAMGRPDRATGTGNQDEIVNPREIVLGACLAIGVLAVMAFDLPNAAALALTALAVGASVVMPGAGLAVIIVLLPHQEPEVLGALGIKLPILLATGYGIGVRLLASRDVPKLGVGVVTVIALLGIAFVSAIPLLNGFAGDRAVASAARFIQFADCVMLVLLGALYFRRREPRLFIVLTLLSVTFACLLAVFQLIAGDAPIPVIGGLYAGGQAQGLARVTGTFQNPNYFGLFAGLGVVLALGVAVEEPRHRRLALLCLPIIGLAVLGTLSRGSVAATGIGIVAWLWFRDRQLATISAVGFLIVGLVVAPLLVDARLGQTTQEAAAAAQQGLSESDQQRFESVAAGTQLFLLDPLFGVGFGQYEYVSPRFVGNSFATSAHNQYLKIFAEQGLLGAAVYAAAAVALLLAMLRSASRWRQTSIAMLAVFAVSGLFLEPLTTFQTSGVMSLMLGVVLAVPAAERVAVPDWSARLSRLLRPAPATTTMTS
ncbi:MAG TPA: O-antigen ligase family protein [Candidatus Limnocylindrales bacterium]